MTLEQPRPRKASGRSHAALITIVQLLALAAGAVPACSGVDSGADGGEPRTIRAGEGIVVELGPREVLLGNGSLGLHYFPDESVALLERHPRLRLILVAAETSYLVEGTDLRHLELATPVLGPGPPGSFDNGYAGPPVPGRWRKYYAGGFTEPGLGGLETPILPPSARAGQPHVVFSEALDRFVMVLISAWRGELRGDHPLERSGIYIAFSRDGIARSEPERLFVDYTLPRLGKSVSWQPTLLWDEGSSTEGWLVYSHSPRWGHRFGEQPHFMVGRRVRLTRESRESRC